MSLIPKGSFFFVVLTTFKSALPLSLIGNPGLEGMPNFFAISLPFFLSPRIISKGSVKPYLVTPVPTRFFASVSSACAFSSAADHSFLGVKSVVFSG